MKPVFKLAGGLGEKLPSVLLGCLLAASWAANAQQATFISPANVGNPPPNVNATNFINSGSWNINTSPLPYQTFSTYNYTNTGPMIGSIGWDFSHGPYPNGVRGWSANFFNNNVGFIQANDGPVSYLLISATNIVNQGTLAAGAGGVMILNGSGVDLSRSGLEITPVVGQQNGPVGNGTNFIPDVAIYDQYWFGGTNTHIFPGAQIWNRKTGTVGVANFNGVGFPCGGIGSAQIGPLNASAADSNTNNFGPFLLMTTNSTGGANPPITVYLNSVRQAVFVTIGDPNISSSIGFGPSLSATNIFLPMSVQLVATTTSLATGSLQRTPIYVVDDLAAVYTNGSLLMSTVINPNAQCTDPTFRPDSVVISRVDSSRTFANSSSGNNGVPTNTFFYDPLTFSNQVSIGRADAYSALVDNLAAEPPLGTSITNAPGKIEVYANDLNLSMARVSAGAEIIIKATNLVSSAGAAMDCQNLSYNLGSTNGLLNITNLAFQTVQRLQGTVSEWSGLWTNYQTIIYPNWVTNAMATNAPFYTEMDITNVTEMDLAITVVDASGLTTTVPVTVQDLVLHSTNMVVSDFMNVANTLLFDGQSLTIGGNHRAFRPAAILEHCHCADVTLFHQ